MGKGVLITGGAGFIGSHLANRLVDHGHRVRALDNLLPQVHGSGAHPDHLHPDVELQIGDVRDREAVERALDGVDAVVHLAARVGIGQSMYEIADYTSVNCHGTAVLLEAMIDRPIRKLLVASSMSVYGEGAYRAGAARVDPRERSRTQLERGEWEPVGPDGEELVPVATPETKPPSLSSIYALGKYDQERMCLLFGQSYGIPTVALRLFNVYGPYQALSNPYTGVLAIFAARLLNDRPPLVFEDGEQRRDFVHVRDVVEACRLALEGPGADGRVVNIGSGAGVTVREIAARLGRVLGKEHVDPEITGDYRVGDTRHCFGDISLARETLGFSPSVGLEEGVADLARWLEGQVAIDRVEDATAQLEARGLTVRARR